MRGHTSSRSELLEAVWASLTRSSFGFDTLLSPWFVRRSMAASHPKRSLRKPSDPESRVRPQSASNDREGGRAPHRSTHLLPLPRDLAPRHRRPLRRRREAALPWDDAEKLPLHRPQLQGGTKHVSFTVGCGPIRRSGGFGALRWGHACEGTWSAEDLALSHVPR